MPSSPSASTRPISKTLQRYGRSVAGGLLFAVASLYTMEIWWQGLRVPPHVVLVTFVGMLVVLTAYAHYDGVSEDKSIFGNVLEAGESLALGFLVTLLVLKLAGQLPPGTSVSEVVTRMVTTGLSASVGVAIGKAQFGEGMSDRDDDKVGLKHDMTLSALGAILIGSGVASTEEIVLMVMRAPYWAPIVVAALSFLLVLGIVAYVGFRGSSRNSPFAGGPFGSACVVYSIALLVAAALLWSAGRFGGVAPDTMVDYTVYLGLPCALGASAGRLLL